MKTTKRTCQDCGKALSRNPDAIRCPVCSKLARRTSPRSCIDCGADVPRKVKRCPDCNAAFLKTRGPTYKRTAETNAKMSAATKGKPKPHLKGKNRPEHARKMKDVWSDPGMRAAAKARGKVNAANPEWRMRIALAVSGDKNPRWRGGIAQTGYAPGFGRWLKRRIRERDEHRCTLCGATEQELGYKCSIHHSDYDKSNHDEDNLFSTCKACNSRVNTNRAMWSRYFAFAAHVRREFGKNVCDFFGRQVVTQSEGFALVSCDGGPDLGGTMFEHALRSLT